MYKIHEFHDVTTVDEMVSYLLQGYSVERHSRDRALCGAERLTIREARGGGVEILASPGANDGYGAWAMREATAPIAEEATE